MIRAALQGYFPTGGFYSVSVPFNLGTDDAVTNWPITAAHYLKTLSPSYQQVVAVLMNHADEDTGDMFLGADETGQGHATEVNQVRFI